MIDEYIIEITNQTIDTELINPFEILREAVEKLKRHESKEKKGSLIDDKTLIGYFALIEKLAIHLFTVDKVRLGEVVTSTGLIHELFYENLFFNPLYSRSKMDNKAKTKEARFACY